MPHLQRKQAATAMVLWLFAVVAMAETATVAVAANFIKPATALQQVFEQQSGHRLRLVSGASGRLYAQIVNGAPFDMLLSADAQKPLALERQGLTVAGSRFSYAEGQLVLWSNKPAIDNVKQALLAGNYQSLAVANERHAPYGVAAMATLAALGLKPPPKQLRRGENISQVFQFVHSKNADMGFVAAAQLQAITARPGQLWPVPPGLHSPIRQQAVLLLTAAANPAATQFYRFLQSPAAQTLIAAYGYRIPNA